jgi:L-alanine-DL-glutamate epimerase-like enolase superfamily enzyme
VAVPARHITHRVTRHAVGAVDHILVDLVQRMANVQVAVGVGRAIMQRKDRLRPSACCLSRIQPAFRQRASHSGSCLGRFPRMGKDVRGRNTVSRY